MSGHVMQVEQVEQVEQVASVVEWRHPTAHLWVGIGPDGVIGSIEVWRRCVASDGAGFVYGRYRELADAKAMLEVLLEQGQVGPLAPRPRSAR